jgi:S-adenosylmethionine uptake transporter
MQAFWVVAAAFFFASMAVCIKIAATHYGTAEMMFYRGVVSMVFMGVVMRTQGVSPLTRVPLMHLWRNVMGVISMAGFFYATAHLPVATAMTLNYMNGIWIAAFMLGGALLYGRMQQPGALMLTLLASFAGVVLILRPSLNATQIYAGLVGLLSGLTSGLAMLQVTALGRAGEPEARIVFYFSVGSMLAGLVVATAQGFTPLSSVPWQITIWLIPIGVLASLGQWAMTRAYSRGSTLLVANLQYIGVIFGAIYSVWLFNEPISWLSWAGMALIVLSAISATLLRARGLPKSPTAVLTDGT